ncbi:uncharacterized protein LOC128338796 isoform X2 [Hemicordylus capensis]|uniref:uncharacterized protein LOC128338796 isoform X2 n=1 Tax=Hemicordylus capensis TaxID=884348 RepID=UPI0023036A00|nr:uncharacterized protein LOC128338796 isoform X2 [Hemicordylus capensis]
MQSVAWLRMIPEGVWHRLGMVTKGEESEVMGVDIKISPLPKGNLDVQQRTLVRDSCRSFSVRFKRMDRSGRFTVLFATRGKSTVHVVDTDNEIYLLLHIETGKDVGLYLYARGVEASGALKKKFKTHAKNLGFSERDIKYPDRDVKCPF